MHRCYSTCTVHFISISWYLTKSVNGMFCCYTWITKRCDTSLPKKMMYLRWDCSSFNKNGKCRTYLPIHIVMTRPVQIILSNEDLIKVWNCKIRVQSMIMSQFFMSIFLCNSPGPIEDTDLVESTKTTSMEDVRTGVLELNKEYLRSQDKAKKCYDVSRHIIAYVKIKKMKIYYPLCQTYSPTVV